MPGLVPGTHVLPSLIGCTRELTKPLAKGN